VLIPSKDVEKMQEFKINAQQKTPRELNRAIKEAAKENERIVIENPNAMHYIAAGLTRPVEVVIDGSAGYFVGTMIHGARVHINGNAGWFPGDNMTEGEVIVDGSAGDGVGQGIYGGTVVVHKSVGSRTGEIMKNGTIIVGGNSGFMSGLFMMGGQIIVLGNISDDAGESIIRGTIYVGGEIKSLGKNAKIEELEKDERENLKELLESYDFNLKEEDYQKFRKIVPRSARPFYGHETEEG
jgi:glutamate synthase domain-containing protein 3